MKKLCFFLLLAFTTISLFSQQALTREELLKKSKSQKTVGFILLGAGATTLIIMSTGDTDLDAAGPLFIGGAAAVLGSIPLFIAAGRNKRKANKMTGSIGLQQAPTMQLADVRYRSFPALSLKIKI
jgi:hypothetical protein